MGMIEHKNYVNETVLSINNLVDDLYEAMMDREDSEVLMICSQLSEKLNEIKEYHTDETLL